MISVIPAEQANKKINPGNIGFGSNPAIQTVDPNQIQIVLVTVDILNCES